MVYFAGRRARTFRHPAQGVTLIRPHFEEFDEAGALDGVQPRLVRVAGVESTLLLVRYVLVAVYGLHLFYDPDDLPFGTIAYIMLAAACLAQNALVHYIALTGRRHWYLSGTYTLTHIASGTLLVTVTGAETSPFVVVYFLLLLAQVLYAPHFRRTYSVLLLCAVAFTIAVFARWLIWGGAPQLLRLCVNYLALFLCYELIRSLASLLHTVEIGLQTRAQELASSKATLRTILDAADGPIVVYDDNEFVTEVNTRACEFFQSSRESLLGTRFRKYFFDDGTLPNKLATLKARGEYQGEIIAVLPEGDELNVNVSVRSYIRGGRRFFVALLHDITAQKHIQEATRYANVELEKINRELQRVDTLRNEFHSTISQRLRSPLSAILGYTDLLVNEELGEISPAQRKALQTCRRSVARVFELVDEAFEARSSAAGHERRSPREPAGEEKPEPQPK